MMGNRFRRGVASLMRRMIPAAAGNDNPIVGGRDLNRSSLTRFSRLRQPTAIDYFSFFFRSAYSLRIFSGFSLKASRQPVQQT